MMIDRTGDSSSSNPVVNQRRQTLSPQPSVLEVVMATRWTLTFDCADPEMLARFWAEALG